MNLYLNFTVIKNQENDEAHQLFFTDDISFWSFAKSSKLPKRTSLCGQWRYEVHEYIRSAFQFYWISIQDRLKLWTMISDHYYSFLSEHKSGHVTRKFGVGSFINKTNHQTPLPRVNCDSNGPDCIDYELPTDPLALEQGKIYVTYIMLCFES